MSLIKTINHKTPVTKKYLAIEIGPDSVKAATWEIVGKEPHVLQTGSIEETDPDSTADLLAAVDASVSKAQADITPEPKEVIFSLPETWVKGDSIDDSKKPLLKELTQKLDLKAIGFVVTTEALVNYLKHKNATPPTAILLGLSESEVIVTIVKNGHISGSQTVGRSDDLVADVEEGIARFGEVSSLPSSMILYDGHTDLESEKQDLISYNWQETLPFLHIPKIEALSSDETVRAVAIAGGFEVISSQNSSQSEPEAAESVETPDSDTDLQPEPSITPDPQPDIPSDIDSLPNLATEFGFTSSDVTLPNSSPTPSSASEPNVDFVVHDPSAENQSEPETSSSSPHSSHRSKSTSPLLKKLAGFPKFTLPNFKKLKLPLLLPLGIAFIILLLVGGGYAYWNIPKASVIVYLTPKVIDADLNFTIDPAVTDINLESSTIPGRPQDITVSGNQETDVTGEKLVGDKAAGTVTIFNRTNSTKTFPAGTKLTGPDQLVYTIDQSITIASASSTENSDLSITTNPSQADVAVSANTIGAQYNLGTGTEFKVANFDSSSFVARAKTDLTGGTSRQITAVSKADQDKLLTDLKKQLLDQALAQADQTGTDNAISAVVIPGEDQQFDTTFSADVGDEAKTLKLEATLTIKAMTYKKSDLSLLIEKAAKDSISQNYQLEKGESQIEVVTATPEDSGALAISAKAKAQILPVISPDDVKQRIKGHYPETTQTYFTSLPSFAKVEIDITPHLPARLRTFPRIVTNISVDFKTTQ